MKLSLLIAASLFFATVAVVPVASATCPPGVVPFVTCTVQNAKNEGLRAAGVAINAACSIVFGDPRACSAAIQIHLTDSSLLA